MKLLILTIAAVLLSATAANAAIFMDTDWWNCQYLNAGGAVASSTFDVKDGDGDVGDIWGFTPGLHVVNNAWVTIIALDDLDLLKSETLKVDLGDIGQQQHFVHNFVLGLSAWPEEVEGTLYGDINADGVLNYTIAANTGDFYLKSANLTVCAECVPEAATIVVWSVLGVLAVTVGWWRKRRIAG
jgi:hypothetical protein